MNIETAVHRSCQLGRLDVLHGDTARWIQRRGGAIPIKRLSLQQRREIRHCFSVIDADGSGALDVDELIEALEQLGAQPKRSEVTALVKELNKGEIEMDLDVFEMLMTRAYSTGMDEEQNNILTSGTSLTFSDISNTLQRKKLLEDVSTGGEQRRSIVRNATALLSEIEQRRSTDGFAVVSGAQKQRFANKKHELLMAQNRLPRHQSDEEHSSPASPRHSVDVTVETEWRSIVPQMAYEMLQLSEKDR